MRKGRMLGGLVVVAAGASALTAGLLAGIVGAGQPQAGSEAVSRVERTFDTLRSLCDVDFCVVGAIPIQVTMPADQAHVDVTLTVTLAYRTSRNDGAVVFAGVDDGTPPSAPMNPRGGFPLAPSQRSTSTTLTWQKRGLPAAGRDYTFELSISSRGLSGDGRSYVRGRKLSVVIETWSAGD